MNNEQDPVSSRYVRWLFDVCRRRRIPEKHLLNHCPLDQATLLEKDRMISWDVVALIHANLGAWLGDDEMIEVGAEAWKHADFKPWLVNAAASPTPCSQIRSLLDPATSLIGTLPIKIHVDDSSDTHLDISMSMAEQALSMASLRLLAGQILSLPPKLGSDSPEFSFTITESGARLEMALPTVNRRATIRRTLLGFGMSPTARRQFNLLVAREKHLAGLENRHQQLAGELADTKALLEDATQQLASRQHEASNFRSMADDLKADFETLIAGLPEAVICTDEQNRVTDYNTATLYVFGHPDELLRGASLETLIPDAASVPMHEPTTMPGSRKPDEELQLLITRLPARGGSLWIVQDQTLMEQADRERSALQHQLQSAQKVDSLGELTGGIAHDFNNLLVAINGYAELGLETPGIDEEIEDYLVQIRDAGERATGMTRKLLTFARRQEMQTTEVDLNQLIKGIERIIERLLPASIQVRFLQSLQAPWVLADPGQLEQVIINLCVNARDAMPDGGALTISVGQREVTKPDDLHAEVAIITIEDTGTGIPPEVAQRIFEPFFTTKPKDEGTGLGLSVVFGIVKRHDGNIEVDSEPGRGTRFQITLPLITPTSSRKTGKQARSSARPIAATETILLIEDNEQVLRLCQRVLTHAGYTVLTAETGPKGLSQFKEHVSTIDLVICDVVLPGIEAPKLFDAIRDIRPSMKVLFSTGYSRDSEQTRFILENDLDMIEKPYTPDTLCERVRGLLDDNRGATD